jgi:ankyrin repeat protein
MANYYGDTPLAIAASYNANPEVLRFLIASGADVNAADESKMTPLMRAARENPNPEVLEVLMDAGADVLATDSDGKNALDYSKGNRKLHGSKALEILREKMARLLN